MDLTQQVHEAAKVSTILNPFNIASVTCVRVTLYLPGSGLTPGCYGAIEFINGTTAGEHKIKGLTIDEVLRKLHGELEALRDKQTA